MGARSELLPGLLGFGTRPPNDCPACVMLIPKAEPWDVQPAVRMSPRTRRRLLADDELSQLLAVDRPERDAVGREADHALRAQS